MQLLQNFFQLLRKIQKLFGYLNFKQIISFLNFCPLLCSSWYHWYQWENQGWLLLLTLTLTLSLLTIQTRALSLRLTSSSYTYSRCRIRAEWNSQNDLNVIKYWSMKLNRKRKERNCWKHVYLFSYPVYPKNIITRMHREC